MTSLSTAAAAATTTTSAAITTTPSFRTSWLRRIVGFLFFLSVAIRIQNTFQMLVLDEEEGVVVSPPNSRRRASLRMIQSKHERHQHQQQQLSAGTVGIIGGASTGGNHRGRSNTAVNGSITSTSRGDIYASLANFKQDGKRVMSSQRTTTTTTGATRGNGNTATTTTIGSSKSGGEVPPTKQLGPSSTTKNSNRLPTAPKDIDVKIQRGTGAAEVIKDKAKTAVVGAGPRGTPTGAGWATLDPSLTVNNNKLTTAPKAGIQDKGQRRRGGGAAEGSGKKAPTTGGGPSSTQNNNKQTLTQTGGQDPSKTAIREAAAADDDGKASNTLGPSAPANSKKLASIQEGIQNKAKTEPPPAAAGAPIAPHHRQNNTEDKERKKQTRPNFKPQQQQQQQKTAKANSIGNINKETSSVAPSSSSPSNNKSTGGSTPKVSSVAAAASSNNPTASTTIATTGNNNIIVKPILSYTLHTNTTMAGVLMPQIDPNVKRSWETDFFQQEQQRIDKRRPLNFVHIPKTGGSSIVEAAIRAGLNWGDCLFQYEWPGRTCPSPPEHPWPENDPEQLGRVWWHVPVQHLQQKQLSNTNINFTFTNPYAGMDLFAVIRNPYERAVSEFLYYCKLHGCGDQFWEDPAIAVEYLNKRVQNGARKVGDAEKGSRPYFFHFGHWVPQNDFFFKHPRRRMIAHVLHTEHLHDEFTSLMKAYNLSDVVTLPNERVKPRSSIIGGKYPLGVQNFTMATLKLLEDVYHDDFVLGGYPMISKLLVRRDTNDNEPTDGVVFKSSLPPPPPPPPLSPSANAKEVK